MSGPIGVLLMAYGGPASLAEIPGYLADIRRGRTTSPELVAEIRDHYRQIGGKSPLLAIAQKQAAAVAARLDPDRFRVYLGMRHWSPWIEETVRQMLDDGIDRAVTLVLAPHYSRFGAEKYHEKVAAGLALHRGVMELAPIRSYHTAPGLIAAFTNRVSEGLGRLPQAEREQAHVVFSAHSLPARILASGDPYDDQLRQTARLVAERAGLGPEQWSFCYQSAGRSAEPWLGPALSEHLAHLAGRGVRSVVSVPVGFVCDHVEILYDIDIEAAAVARGLGIRLERPPALNDDPLFIGTLVELITERAGGWAFA
jgi:ferrochelatase